MMSKSLKKAALRRYERIITHNFVRNQNNSRRRFQEDFGALKDDLEVMSQSLKNILLLLQKMVQDIVNSNGSRGLLLVLKIVSQFFISFKASNHAIMASKCLSVLDSVEKIYSLNKLEERKEGVKRNLEQYSEIANSNRIKKLVRDFHSIMKSTTLEKRAQSCLEEKMLWNIYYILEAPSPNYFLTSFRPRIIHSLCTFNFIPDAKEELKGKRDEDLALDLYNAIEPEINGFESPNEKKKSIEKCIVSVQEKIHLMNGFVETAKDI